MSSWGPQIIKEGLRFHANCLLGGQLHESWLFLGIIRTRSVARQDSSPELMLVSQIKKKAMT